MDEICKIIKKYKFQLVVDMRLKFVMFHKIVKLTVLEGGYINEETKNQIFNNFEFFLIIKKVRDSKKQPKISIVE